MKRKIVLVFLTTLSLGIMTACGSSDSSNTDNKAQSVSTDVTYEAIDLITDWNTMATITLGDTITIDGKGAEVANDTVIEITEGGEYIFSGTLANGAILVNTDDDVKITLNGVDITNSTGPCIYGESSSSIYVEAKKGTDNNLTDGNTYDTDDLGEDVGKGTIFSNDAIVMVGDGNLNITANYKHGICSDDNVYVEGCNITITAAKDCIHANDIVCVDDGTLELDAVSDGMESEALMVLNGGTISVTSDDEGIEGKYSVEVNGGDISIECVDDGYNAGSDITINGGNSYILSSRGDAVDSNGAMTINDGLLCAFGGSAPEGGLDCDDTEISINGGTIIATGDVNSPISEDSKQASILIGSFSTGDNIGILDADGNTVFAFTAPVSSSNMVVSIAGITADADYDIYTGGTISGDETFHGYYAKGIYAGGSVSQSFTADSQVISAGGSSTTMGQGGGGGQMGGGQMPNGEAPSDSNMQKGGTPPDNSNMQQGGTPPSAPDSNSNTESTL